MNFKGYIGVPLENIANSYFDSNHIPVHISADELETGAYISVVSMLLFMRCRNDDNVLAFLQSVKDYLGLPASKIPFEHSYAIYKNFIELFQHHKLHEE